MYMILGAAAPVSATTGYLIFAVSILILAGIFKYFTSTNEI